MESIARKVKGVRNLNSIGIYFLLFYFSLYFDESYSIKDFKLLRFKREILNCTDTQFRCENGQCIDETLLCDGIKDCSDSSDETEEQCRHIYCPSYTFRCAYGACIDRNGKCDGKQDCVDKSDESPSICSNNIAEVDSKTCKENEFQCASNQCIKIDSICDGSKDCENGSDETYNLCKDTICDKRFFRCAYGACIDPNYQCDGIQHCVDGSDESIRTCKKRKNGTEQSTTSTPPSLSDEFCIVPSPSSDKTVKYKCYGGSGKSCYTNGDKVVRQFTVATFECNRGFSRREGKQFQSVCLDLGWQPPISNCHRTCERLAPINMNLNCFRNGSTVNCEEDLIAGTIVRPTCKQSSIYKEFVPVYEEILCQEDGKWNNLLFPCVPGSSNYYFIYLNIAILYLLSLALFFYFRRKFSKSRNSKI